RRPSRPDRLRPPRATATPTAHRRRRRRGTGHGQHPRSPGASARTSRLGRWARYPPGRSGRPGRLTRIGIPRYRRRIRRRIGGRAATDRSHPMTTATPPAGFRRRPLKALAKAEYLQFRRNKTLVYTATVFPIGLPLALYFIARRDAEPTAAMAATAFEMFALLALLFMQYYSVLSMVTTRRGEGVLKRLRTGEAADWQIQTAPGVPGAVVTLFCTVVIAAV